VALSAPLGLALQAAGPCPEEPPLQSFTGAGTTGCFCFVAGEEAGAVLDAPAAHYPIEILRVGIGWGSQFGGAPQSLEQAIKIYPNALPDPGTPLFTLLGPALNDGFINEFDLEPLPGDILVNGGPFTVTLQFANDNVGNPFAPTMVHDGNGCQPGKNVVKAIPGGWSDACQLGVGGDWQVYVVYRPVNCTGGSQTYCVGSVNSTGQGASIGMLGSTSVAANDLILSCAQGPPGQVGIFFYGPNQVQVPFGDGFRCVGGGTFRLYPPQQTDAFGDLVRPLDLTVPPANGGPGMIQAGDVWNFQFWYRDPAAGGAGFNFSDGLSVTFCP
jgi:hypothetical protein